MFKFFSNSKLGNLSRALLFFVLLLANFSAWSFASPVGGAPDEDNLVTTVWCGELATNLRESKNLRPYRESLEFDGKVKPATEFCRYDPQNYKYHLVPYLAANPHQCFVSSGQNESAACQTESKSLTVRKFFESAVDTTYIKSIRNFVGSDVESSVVKMRLFNSFLAAV